MDVSTRWWYGHLTVGPKTQGCVSMFVVSTSHIGTENTWLCLHVGGMNISQWNRKHRDVSTRWWYRHLTLEQKTHGCVYTLVVWTPHRGTENTGMSPRWWYRQTSHSGTENTGMCLHVGGVDISQWNRKHRDVSTRWWCGHLTVEQKTHGCVYTVMV